MVGYFSFLTFWSIFFPHTELSVTHTHAPTPKILADNGYAYENSATNYSESCLELIAAAKSKFKSEINVIYA